MQQVLPGERGTLTVTVLPGMSRVLSTVEALVPHGDVAFGVTK